MSTDQERYDTYVKALGQYAIEHPRPAEHGPEFFLPWAEERTKAALNAVVDAEQLVPA